MNRTGLDKDQKITMVLPSQRNKHDASWRITKKYVYNCIYIELLGETRVTRKHYLGNFWTLSVHPKFDWMIIHDGMLKNRRIALSMVHETQQAAIRNGGGGQTPNVCPPFQPPKLVAWSNPPVSQNPKRFAKSLHDYQRAQQCRWVSSLRGSWYHVAMLCLHGYIAQNKRIPRHVWCVENSCFPEWQTTVDGWNPAPVDR